MKLNILSPEEAEKELERMKKESIARGGVLTSDLAVMINQDIQKTRANEAQKQKTLVERIKN